MMVLGIYTIPCVKHVVYVTPNSSSLTIDQKQEQSLRSKKQLESILLQKDSMQTTLEQKWTTIEISESDFLEVIYKKDHPTLELSAHGLSCLAASVNMLTIVPTSIESKSSDSFRNIEEIAEIDTIEVFI